MSIWIRKKKGRAPERIRAQKIRPRPALCALALPEDATGRLTRLILLGSGRALVENILGVAEVMPGRVLLATREGLLRFTGRNLRLEDVRPGALTVVGQIEEVALPHPLGEEVAEHD